ncbi:MAG: ABC transporter ATP-binding protein [Clostridia bacterium]|nr:ABC transporter ATP-binding protein [Clostridia bacterium]MBQ7120691.1 ABC transporter ATP-binding protein [Clostridia bacterium]
MAPKMKKPPKGGGPGNPQKPKNTKATFARLLSYLGKSKIMLVFVFIFVAFSALAGIIGTSFVETITDDFLLPLIGSEITKELLAPLVKTLIILGIIYILGVVSSYTYSRIMLQVAQKTLNTIRKDLFDHMMDLPIKFFDTHTHGELMSRYTNDADVLRECISQSFVQLVSSTVTVVGTFIMMLYYSPVLTLFVIAMLFIAFFVVKTLGKQSAKYFRQQQKCVGEVNGYIEEYIEGLKVIKVFCHEDAANSGFGVINGNLRHAATNAHTYASILMPIMGNMSYITYAATATIGSLLIMTVPKENFFGISVGALFTFLIYTRQFFQPITQISQQFNNIIAALAGAERIFEIIDTPVEEDNGYVTLVNARKLDNGAIVECEERTGIWAWKHPHGDGTLTYTEWKGDVRFHDVTFSYDGKKTVLKNVSLYARPGEKIAFVGSTGAGKTTITNLINRFYDVDEGKITYDGINIKKIKKSELRRSMAMVLQDTHLFTGTVRDNIAYGRLDATDEEIVAAAKLANADSFITRLPDGYDTMITGDGANLSQGQRQLLAIARAAVADPPVLILDEATSSIDTRTERLIEKGMDKLMEGRTVFVIAHRLSTVRNSNAIMVLENGEIIERGDHDDLIAQQGKYYQLYTGQFELD